MTAGAAAVGATPALAATGKLEVFVLDPEWNDAGFCRVREGRKSGACHGCKACHRHGRNKIFRSADTADDGRAHQGCRCLVKSGGKLPREKWVALFGPPRNPRRDSVDRRDPRTQRILSADVKDADGDGTATGNTGGGAGDLPFTGLAVGTLAAIGAGLAAAGRAARHRDTIN